MHHHHRQKEMPAPTPVLTVEDGLTERLTLRLPAVLMAWVRRPSARWSTAGERHVPS